MAPGEITAETRYAANGETTNISDSPAAAASE